MLVTSKGHVIIVVSLPVSYLVAFMSWRGEHHHQRINQKAGTPCCQSTTRLLAYNQSLEISEFEIRFRGSPRLPIGCLSMVSASMGFQRASTPLLHHACPVQRRLLLRSACKRNLASGKPSRPPSQSQAPVRPGKPLVSAKPRDPSAGAGINERAKTMQKSTVAWPRTRIAIGLVFCGSIIYSMVRG